ncbi:MAG: RbsD/FucU domain-containing protein [Candidatus Pacebacteria bacterium]|nr:RbsD/FucU domain-containing protein [Candidatus Paceibacterota bacterium]
MLKNIDPVLSPDLLRHLAGMGHAEWVAVVDANFTGEFLAQRHFVRLPGLNLERVCQAILSVFPLDDFVAQPVGFMQSGRLKLGEMTLVQAAVARLVYAEGLKPEAIESIERFAFYERVKSATLVVQTGEESAYGNYLFSKGVIATFT